MGGYLRGATRGLGKGLATVGASQLSSQISEAREKRLTQYKYNLESDDRVAADELKQSELDIRGTEAANRTTALEAKNELIRGRLTNDEDRLRFDQYSSQLSGFYGELNALDTEYQKNVNFDGKGTLRQEKILNEAKRQIKARILQVIKTNADFSGYREGDADRYITRPDYDAGKIEGDTNYDGVLSPSELKALNRSNQPGGPVVAPIVEGMTRGQQTGDRLRSGLGVGSIY